VQGSIISRTNDEPFLHHQYRHAAYATRHTTASVAANMRENHGSVNVTESARYQGAEFFDISSKMQSHCSSISRLFTVGKDSEAEKIIHFVARRATRLSGCCGLFSSIKT
jgi:hypothetical protein